MTEFCDLVKNLEAALKSHTDNMASFHSAQPDRLPQELSHASQRYSTTVDSFTDLQAPATHTTHATQALQQQIDTLPSHYARYWSPSLPRSTHSLGDGPNQDVCPPTMNHHETTDVTLPPPESAHTLQQRILELTEQRDAALRQSANWEQAHQKLQADHSRVSHELRQLQLQHPRSISPAEIPGPTVQELQAHIATLEQREQLLRQELTLSQTMLADARKASDVERSRREEEFTTHEQLKAPVRQALSPVTQLSAQVQCHIEILTTELLKARAKHKAERQQWRHRMAFLPSRDSINAITDQSAATPHADVEHVQRQLRAARSMLQPIRTAIFQIQSSHQRLATRCSVRL